MLRNTSDLNLTELNRNERLVKAVVIGFPFSIPSSELAKHEKIANVERMRNIEGQETKAMLCSFIGDRPDTINLGIWGTFKVRVYHPEPLRCFNCQRFGHHKSACQSNAKCAVCSGRYKTSSCIEKHKAGEQTHPRCPNCRLNHPAWSRRCPERLDKIKASLPPESERKQPTPLPRRHFYSRAELQRRSQSRNPRESSQRRTPTWNNRPHGRTAPKTLPRTIFCNTDNIKNCFASFIQVALINAKATLSMDNIESLSHDFLESLCHASRSLQPIPSKAPPTSSSSSSSTSNFSRSISSFPPLLSSSSSSSSTPSISPLPPLPPPPPPHTLTPPPPPTITPLRSPPNLPHPLLLSPPHLPPTLPPPHLPPPPPPPSPTHFPLPPPPPHQTPNPLPRPLTIPPHINTNTNTAVNTGTQRHRGTEHQYARHT